ncbi:hypothetical protein B0T24DRAFT_685257 [Lasiosphaeria ovina]|uniref:Uncharacterized protein n=1 Tax=Lasiosphaeria ovina TaxID=92902 RepID=A0AAE0MZ09_9PEZI|nr:hypothetical protein B0T24DRAFT_685257 [Lasiosphaeria ovina]
MPVAAVDDGYGRPVMVSPTPDGYPAAVVSHHGNPPTPHSFHGSQSSIQAEDDGFGHYPPINGHNHNGYHVEPVAQTGINHLSLNPHMNGAIHTNAVSAPFQSVQEQGETLDFLRRGISDNTFNDCVVIEAAFRFRRGCIFLDVHVQDEYMRPSPCLLYPPTGRWPLSPQQAAQMRQRLPMLLLSSYNPRLSSQIKFGDISPPNRNGHVPHDAAVGPEAVKKGNRMPSPNDTILSRILLNLPFDLLKRVLEHPQLAKPSGELSIPARASCVFQDTLDKAADPLAVEHVGDFLVNNMGYKEQVFLRDLPYLVHRWLPTGSVGGSNTA